LVENGISTNFGAFLYPAFKQFPFARIGIENAKSQSVMSKCDQKMRAETF
jgi:hypothetical protein